MRRKRRMIEIVLVVCACGLGLYLQSKALEKGRELYEKDGTL